MFKAFVDAGAISKANADDPKKSALIRCARTDKGVHAAGNLVSLKLIVEDPDVISKINEKLSPQIRVFGVERTSGSFSAYQYCDSRIYEYLIPTHCFLPPHPSSYLAKKLVELAEEANDLPGYEERQEEVSSYWAETEERYISPVLEGIDPSIRSIVQKALYEVRIKDAEEELAMATKQKDEIAVDVLLQSLGESDKPPRPCSGIPNGDEILQPVDSIEKPDTTEQDTHRLGTPALTADNNDKANKTEKDEGKPSESEKPTLTTGFTMGEGSFGLLSKESSPLETAVRQLRSAYIKAGKAYRIHPRRLERVHSTLSRYIGTQNFHNYTVDKSFRDASAKRVIKSFVVSSEPIIIGDTEWLSLKVHGQSFMMHQIRKMVSMAAMIVRCGSHEGRVQDSYMADKLTIPKAPGLGLLLERPVFDTYNERCNGQYDREPIDFNKYEKEMEEFKQREIYQRIFREEERDNTYAVIRQSLHSMRLIGFFAGSTVSSRQSTISKILDYSTYPLSALRLPNETVIRALSNQLSPRMRHSMTRMATSRYMMTMEVTLLQGSLIRINQYPNFGLIHGVQKVGCLAT